VGGNPFRRVKNKLLGGQPDQDLFSLSSKLVLEFAMQDIHRLLKWLDNVYSYKFCLNILFDHKPFT
jgi:hypothetical protein